MLFYSRARWRKREIHHHCHVQPERVNQSTSRSGFANWNLAATVSIETMGFLCTLATNIFVLRKVGEMTHDLNARKMQKSGMSQRPSLTLQGVIGYVQCY